MRMPTCRFSLNISPEEFRKYYRGVSRHVMVRAENGRSLAFPAAELQRFVSHDGVAGYFEITFTTERKLVRVTRIGDLKPVA